METYAVCLLPRREYVERFLRLAEAQRYVELFNRLMRADGVTAQIVPEPVEEQPCSLSDETQKPLSAARKTR